jgi:hypothetical protein
MHNLGIHHAVDSHYINSTIENKNMKITKNELIGRMEYLHNVTGVRFQLSSQLAGKGRGYSVMLDGSHVMTWGHVTALELDHAITAFCKGFYFKEKMTLADANSNAKTIGRQLSSFPSSQSCPSVNQ